jgi:hypothetical protein
VDSDCFFAAILLLTRWDIKAMLSRLIEITSKPLRCLGVVFAFVVPWIVSPTDAHADEPFYRCVVNGKTIYTDKPCDVLTRPSMEESSASTSSKASDQAGKPAQSIELDYTKPYGIWRGQAQYQASEKGQLMHDAHAVMPLVLQVEKQGRVRGTSPENGCKMLGVAAPYVTPNILMLDVTLSGCRYPAFNRRYSGTLALYQSNNSVQFSLHSINVESAFIGKVGYLEIKATMRR